MLTSLYYSAPLYQDNISIKTVFAIWLVYLPKYSSLLKNVNNSLNKWNTLNMSLV